MATAQSVEDFSGQISQSSDQILQQIQPELMLLLDEHRTSINFQEMYRNIFQLVLHKKGQELYEMVQNAAVKHLKEKALPSIKNSASSDKQFLKALLDEWNHYEIALNRINDVMTHLNQSHAQEEDLEPTKDLMKRLFRELVLQDTVVDEKLKTSFMSKSEEERKKSIDDDSIFDGIQKLVKEFDLGH